MASEFRKKFLSNAGLALTVNFALLAAIILLSGRISFLRSSIAGARRELNLNNQKVISLADLKKDSKIAESYFGILNRALPKKEELYLFKQEVFRLGEISGLGRPGFTFGGETASTEDAPGKVRFAVTADGEYVKIFAFMKSLEKTSYFTNLTNFDIIQRNGKFNGQLGGEVFFR